MERSDHELIENADSVVVAPCRALGHPVALWGDLVVSEGAKRRNGWVGGTPEGGVYRLAKNTGGHSAFAGSCFGPDGLTLCTHIQGDGLTLAITGPW